MSVGIGLLDFISNYSNIMERFSMTKVTSDYCTLTSWEVKKVLGTWIIWGQIVSDPNGRAPLGWICTPELISIDFLKRLVYTVDGIFQLKD